METTKIYIPVYFTENNNIMNSLYYFTNKSEAEKYAQEFTNNSSIVKKFLIEELSGIR